MCNSDDYLKVYQQITSRLKNRNFFKKASPSESIKSYNNLLNTLVDNGEYEYSGLVTVALAKCEAQEKNSVMEASYYCRAARFFFRHQRQLDDVKSPSYSECGELGIKCLSVAIQMYLEMNQPSMAASLYYELAYFELETNRVAEASQHFIRAATLQQNKDAAMFSILSLKKSLECDIREKSFEHATQLLQWIIKLAVEQSTLNEDVLCTDIKIECLISMILIAILQKDYSQARLLNEHAQKEYYRTQNFEGIEEISRGYLGRRHGRTHNAGILTLYNDMHFMNQQFFDLIEYLIYAVEWSIEKEVIQVRDELCEVLTPIQKELLRCISQQVFMTFN
ncbi:40-kDa huntingtin-associated protein-like [Schistocerca gregaria]|uniref:40-kDa huntingtin-associated protein-like n=1 Tax=Schistocerca gregaria TaxID=7010 RepID=UPI00211F1CD0|nr:40-kDa huntingtin-associated protein-like [Schistocerca gregaria]XP_049849134.1 40-kDa huntingtin-associated protein-like [Schistocerca gregaria]XP_049849135.1 40-kDa huntingtin-associated protein-like [Schistocerca gregaria]